ncbi:hypothetical protein CRG98_007319 [Punica granatum]|uniref:Uncharacterized protein n=1 Tax=Punica granatum TaxID=22663 RepID=A0A2I0KUU5_PUNGR|nr:hypothetical protein CRG98_007319 [Punica granatum]
MVKRKLWHAACRMTKGLLDNRIVCSRKGLYLSKICLVIGATASLRMPRSCDEELELWGGVPTYPKGLGIIVCRSSCVCCTYDPGIIIFALAMRMGSHFRRPRCEASKALVGHARAYRDILNDALAAPSIIRRASQLRTLLVRALLRPDVSFPGAYCYMLSVVGLCGGEGPICPKVSLDIDGDTRVDVEWFARSSLSSASWGVPSCRALPPSKYSEKDPIRVLGESGPMRDSLVQRETHEVSRVEGHSILGVKSSPHRNGHTVAGGHVSVLSPGASRQTQPSQGSLVEPGPMGTDWLNRTDKTNRAPPGLS